MRSRVEGGQVGRLQSMRGLMLALALLASGAAVSRAEPTAEPDGYRMNDYRSPVPETLKGAKVVNDAAAAKALAADKRVVFIDVYPRPPKPDNLPPGTVWRNPPHESIPGSVWLANVGYGVIPPAMEQYFNQRLETLTGADKARPVVFFCLRNCWMSWNAAKRALALGYTDVTWFPDGVDAWRELELPTANIEPLP